MKKDSVTWIGNWNPSCPLFKQKRISPFARRLRYDACQPLFPWCDGHLFPTPAVRTRGTGALLLRRALFERSELDRPPVSRGRPILMRSDWASMVLGPFAEI